VENVSIAAVALPLAASRLVPLAASQKPSAGCAGRAGYLAAAASTRLASAGI
jgi:hypothetical protein